LLASKSAEADRLLNSLLVDSSKIRSELGWRPSFSLDEGMAETARWFLQTGAASS
jgi:UDP-glucose 4-epimerase